MIPDIVGRALRRSWWVVLIGLFLGGVLGAAASLVQSPSYATSVTFFVASAPDTVDNALQGDVLGQQRVATYEKLLDGQRLAQLVVRDGSTGLSARQVSDRITGSADPSTVLLVATVTDTSAARSLSVAEKVATAFPTLVNTIESADGTQKAPVSLDVVSGPTLDPNPVSRPAWLLIVAGALVGLLLGIAVALARAALDRRVRTLDELGALAGAPTLGFVPSPRSARKRPVLSEDEEGSPRADAFRRLRTTLEFTAADHPLGVLAVVSARSGEGRTSTAANLALMYAEDGRRVAVVDADLRSPHLAGYLETTDEAGLGEVLRGESDVEDVLRESRSGAVSVVSAGQRTEQPSRVLSNGRLAPTIALLRARFDLVVLDTAPMEAGADAVVVASLSDGAVVVGRDGLTRGDEVRRLTDALDAVGAPVLGVVISGSRER